MAIYLDHAATTLLSDDTIEYFTQQLKFCNANPASRHALGMLAAEKMKEAQSKFASILGCQAKEIVYTSGGTESINTALKTPFILKSRLPRRIITSLGEHDAVKNSCKQLEALGVEVDYLPLTPQGTVDLNHLEAALQKQPAGLMSFVYVNNEIGSINPISEIVQLRNRYQKNCLIHIDGVQALGKIPFQFRTLGVDLLSGSSHKIFAPKGMGWLVVKDKINLMPLMSGGGQQNNKRSGTENAPLLSTMVYAAEKLMEKYTENLKQVEILREHFLNSLQRAGLDYKVLSPSGAVPHILSLHLPLVRAETLLTALSAEGVYVSIGSACASKKIEQNAVLTQMGYNDQVTKYSLRISFAASNTLTEIEEASAILIRYYKQLQTK